MQFGKPDFGYEASAGYMPSMGDAALAPVDAENEPAAPPPAALPVTPPAALQPALPLLPAEQSAPPPAGASRGAGFGVLVAGAAIGAGAVLGGWAGAGAGLLLMGALRNGLRAGRLWSAPSTGERGEAAKNASLAVIGVAAGGYLSYRAYQSRKGSRS